MLTLQKCSGTGLSSDLNNSTFYSLYFLKKIVSEGHLLFQSIKKIFVNFVNLEKIEKIFCNL